MKKFEMKFTIPYYDCNKLGHVRPISLLKYLGETSLMHSENEGMGANEFEKMNYAWLLNRWRVRFYSYPLVKEQITIETWPSNFYKFYANRDFKIYDSNKKLVGKASSLWVLMDTNRKRPIRITDDIYDSSKIIKERAFEDFYEFDEELDIENELDFRVRKSDIDYNNHVNNAKYLEWLLEVIDEEVDNNYILSEFEILYKKEIKYGNFITSQIAKKIKEENGLEYIHKIIDKNTWELRTFGRTLWKRENN